MRPSACRYGNWTATPRKPCRPGISWRPRSRPYAPWPATTPDVAALDNNLGFVRSDVPLGYTLASAPLSSAIDSPGMALLVWRMAMCYRRQVPPRLNFAIGFTDQIDFFD